MVKQPKDMIPKIKELCYPHCYCYQVPHCSIRDWIYDIMDLQKKWEEIYCPCCGREKIIEEYIT